MEKENMETTKDEALKLAAEVLRAKGYNGLADHLDKVAAEEETPPKSPTILVRELVALYDRKPPALTWGDPETRAAWRDWNRERSAIVAEMRGLLEGLPLGAYGDAEDILRRWAYAVPGQGSPSSPLGRMRAYLKARGLEPLRGERTA